MSSQYIQWHCEVYQILNSVENQVKANVDHRREINPTCLGGGSNSLPRSDIYSQCLFCPSPGPSKGRCCIMKKKMAYSAVDLSFRPLAMVTPPQLLSFSLSQLCSFTTPDHHWLSLSPVCSMQEFLPHFPLADGPAFCFHISHSENNC